MKLLLTASAAASLIGACASNPDIGNTGTQARSDISHRAEIPQIANSDPPLVAASRARTACESSQTALTAPIGEPVVIVGRISYDDKETESRWSADNTQPKPKSKPLERVPATNAIWDDIRQGLRFKRPSRQAIDAEISWIVQRKEYLRRALIASTPYLHYVVNEVKRRGLPTELALLPIIESGFDPKAISPTGAMGLWQFMPSTAKALGMRQSVWYDARGDVIASTQAALTYLANLNNRFGSNWALTLAAYNAGAAKVWRAMQQNRHKGEPEDYWSLPLPAETNRYVPRLLAIAEIISHPGKYKFRLPRIANEPQFDVLTFKGPVDLSRLAKLAGANFSELASLNPGFKHTTTDPHGPRYLLVPKSAATTLQATLASGKAKAASLGMASYVVKSGDSLGGIAQRHGVSVKTLKSINQLRSSRILSGSKLVIPVARPQDADEHISAAQRELPDIERIVHTVKTNESLSIIARRYGVTYIDLAQWNDLNNDEPLRPGQRIEIKHALTGPKQDGQSI